MIEFLEALYILIALFIAGYIGWYTRGIEEEIDMSSLSGHSDNGDEK